MVLTRVQVDGLSREELIEKLLLSFSDIMDQLNVLNSRFQDFVKKYNKINSELLISKNCNSLLLKRVTDLERNALNNAQYIRRETIEINPVPQLTPLLTKRIKYVERLRWLVRQLHLRIFKAVIV